MPAATCRLCQTANVTLHDSHLIPPGVYSIVRGDRPDPVQVRRRETITIAPAIETAYRAPCPSGTDVLSGNRTFDVHVVSTALLSTAGAPASLPRTSLWESGIVLERTPGGMRPISGASAELAADDSDAFVASTTLTDGSGRYLLCTAPPGVGTDQIAWVRVRKEGYRPAASSIILGGGNQIADIELVRN